ncbi:efflux RND transporter periplasmic adaptor subunit [Zavarzinella formosa]|uniref:efflux RND transporter periplasmic adaptor subunit n=1 Tax=Zavarzinella formosa TaxID=360055 RepID=UPI0002FB0850|nr:efflux RND transporter periplasmic adaptor subunit [Zavarzinella formosa]
MWRAFKWLVILGVAGGGMAFAAQLGKNYLQAKAIPQFTVAKVSRGRVETVVNSTGPVKPVQSLSVGSFISGPIAEILVDFNSVVKKGQLLARIDPRLSQAAADRERAGLATQKADLARIEAQLKQAERNEQRAINLKKANKDYVSDQEMDQLHFARVALDAQVKLSLANISSAEASVKNAETNLEFTKIISPADGIVIDRKVDSGQTVASSFQTPEMFIIGPDMEKHMHVYASVDEADIGHLRASQEQDREVSFTVDAYPEDVFKGKIYQVRKSSTTTQNVVTYPVIIEAPNPALKLMPGMTANVSFQIDVRESVLRVPMAALRYMPPSHLVRPEDKELLDVKPVKDPKEGEEKLSATQRAIQAKNRFKRLVWVRDGNLLRAVPVTLGLMDGQFAELLTGDLTEGQELVTGVEGEKRP